MDTLKLYISPPLETAPYGIRRVIEAMTAGLPEHGITLVDSEGEADVVNVHATAYVETSKPIVYSSHGLYWADYVWPEEYYRINQQMIDYMTRCQAITAVSKWVGHAISRGILRTPNVIYHGVDTDVWKPGETKAGYVLWNKARADVVCNPQEMNRLAVKLPGVGFVSTIGEAAPNVQITGVVEYEQMLDMVQQAGAYLCLARETMGIGTLEALACGVPVVGWDFGGQREIMNEIGEGALNPVLLAEPGDYDQLAELTAYALENQEKLTLAAREAAVNMWGWDGRIKQYADLFHATYQEAIRTRPAVSVIVTAHNLAKYLPDCLNSVKAQTADDWECLIVDDASTDDTFDIAYRYAELDSRFKYHPTPFNLKLSGSRNYGFSQSNGRYIIPLDADDMLGEHALDILSRALDENPDIHIAYGHLDVIGEDGSGRRRNDWPFEQFNWFGQMAHLNQLSYSSMMRREVLENSGGYRVRDWRAEDSSLWCRVTSLGHRAAKVTNESTLVYRFRGDSKSQQERAQGYDDGDWTSWLPWRLAGSVKEGIEVMKKGLRPSPSIVPFGAQGRNGVHNWPIWSYHDPLVSVVIPVGPGHEKYLVDSLDSIQAQTFPFWEAIVVNDTGYPLDLKYAPWAKVVEAGQYDIATARNAGVAAAIGPLVLFLDADDMLTPNAMFDMVSAYVEADGSKYVYGDWYAVSDKIVKKNSREYDRQHWQKEGLHPINILINREWITAVGGFDENLPGWEDWEFFIKLAINGYCGHRIQIPIMVYRMHGGQRREQSLNDAGETLPILRERYAKYFEGGETMAPCCGDGGSEILEAKMHLNMLERPSGEPKNMNGQEVRIKFIGTQRGSITLKRVNGILLTRPYVLGDNPLRRYTNATPGDAELLILSGLCEYVNAPAFDPAHAAVPQPDYPTTTTTPPSAPIAEPAPSVQEPIVVDLEEVASKSVAELKGSLFGLDLKQLKTLRSLETTGKNRKSALAAIDTLITDTERVG